MKVFKFLIAASVIIINLKCFPQSITNENIRNAEAIIGLEFTDAEIDSMQTSLDDQLVNFQNIRKIDLTNSVPSAIIFNPIRGIRFSKRTKSIKFSNYSYVKLPGDINELAFYSIGELAELIKTKQITSTELTKFFLNRLTKYDPELHCVITLTEQRALNQARFNG